MTVVELERYRREVMEEHRAELAAIDRLIGRERGKQPPVPASNHAQGSFHLATRVSVRKSRSTSSLVHEAIQKTTGDFNRKDIANIIAADHPNSVLRDRALRITLWRLSVDGKIRTVSGGRGRIPAVYRKK